MANAFSFAELVDNTHATHDSKKEDAFAVEMNGKVVKFPRSEDRLYFYELPATYEPIVDAKKNIPEGPVLLSTVEENMEGFSENQIQRAK